MLVYRDHDRPHQCKLLGSHLGIFNPCPYRKRHPGKYERFGWLDRVKNSPSGQ